MKILSSLHSYNITGVLKQNISLLKYLRTRAGIDVLVIGPKENLGTKILEEEGFIAENTFGRSINDILRGHNFHPDFVLSESLFSVDLSDLAKELGAKHIIRIHEEIPFQSGKGLWLLPYKPVNDYFQKFKNSRVVFTSSHTAYHYEKPLQEFNINFEVIHGSIDEERLRGQKETLSFSDFQILQLGTVYERKGGLKTLEAFSNFLNRGGIENANLIFAGARNANDKEIQYKEKLGKRASELGIANKVIVYDTMKNPYIIMNGSSVVTLHSYSECFPTVFLEAMYFGKMIVSSNVGGVAEQIYEGVTGHLFGPGDISSQSDAFLKLYNERDLLKNRSKIIRGRYNDYFSQDSSGERFLKLLER
ncbi:glycosyltransferase family 4 protein [Candidatus Pacearchaeota archaeon]|nr:glycosyltransferase family 4 protein [Candidatus Pacearchaeota archaeon]